jgi:hypothetical protein
MESATWITTAFSWILSVFVVERHPLSFLLLLLVNLLHTRALFSIEYPTTNSIPFPSFGFKVDRLSSVAFETTRDAFYEIDLKEAEFLACFTEHLQPLLVADVTLRNPFIPLTNLLIRCSPTAKGFSCYLNTIIY